MTIIGDMSSFSLRGAIEAMLLTLTLRPRLHQGNMLLGNMYPFVSSNMLPATKLLPFCCPSVAGYKGIGLHVAEQHVALV